MSKERILNEFQARVVKTKTFYETVKYQCDLLKKQAINLEKELEEIQISRQCIEMDAQQLNENFISTNQQNQDQHHKVVKDLQELNNLKKYKTALKRELEVSSYEVNKLSNRLEEVRRDKLQVQTNVKVLNDKLKSISEEKMLQQQELENQNTIIQLQNDKILALKLDMEAIKHILSNDFHLNNEVTFQ